MSRRTVLLFVSAALVVTSVLLLDGAGLGRQAVLGAATALCLWAMVRASGVSPVHVACAMTIATAMEIVGSLGWGLYAYRHAAIPFYVPFGHGVFYTLAVAASRDDRLVARQRAIVGAVAIAGCAYAALSLAVAGDASGAVMWVIALGLGALSRQPLLLAACAVSTVALEWVGTSIGNWAWAPVVPGLGLPSANPPSGVAVCYVLLDFLTLSACTSGWMRRLQPAGPAPASALRPLPEPS